MIKDFTRDQLERFPSKELEILFYGKPVDDLSDAEVEEILFDAIKEELFCWCNPIPKDCSLGAYGLSYWIK